MTRGAIAQVLFNFDRDSTAGAANAFSDTAGTWYADAANWAASVGVVNGTGGGFNGEAPLTREQLATMLYRYAEAKGYETTPSAPLGRFGDSGDISDYRRRR